MQQNLGLYCVSWSHFKILFFEYSRTKWFVKAPLQDFCILRDSCASRNSMPNLICLAASLSHVWVLLGDPFNDPRGVVLERFEPLYIRIHVGTLGTKFYLQTSPKTLIQNTTTH